MKHILLLAFISCFLLHGFTQVSSLSAYAETGESADCNEYIYVTVVGGAQDDMNSKIYVEWGDGMKDSLITYILQGNTLNFTFSHKYIQSDTYQATVSAWSAVTQSMSASQTVAVTVPFKTACGVAKMKMFHYSQVTGAISIADDIPMQFKGANGQVVPQLYPVFSDSSGTYYSGLDINNSPYVPLPLHMWLLDNNKGIKSLTLGDIVFNGEKQSENVPGEFITTSCENGGCKTAHFNVYENLPLNFTPNFYPRDQVVLDFTDANGNMTTIFPVRYNSVAYDHYPVTDTTLMPYQVSINDDWLLLKGLEQHTPDCDLNDNSIYFSGSFHTRCAHCGFTSIFTSSDDASLDLGNVPYDFTDINGSTTTLFPFQANTYKLPDLGGAPFIVSVNDTWLDEHGVSQLTPDQTVAFPDGPFEASSPAAITMEVSCNAVVDLPDLSFSQCNANPFLAPLQQGSVSLGFCNDNCMGAADARIALTYPAFLVPDLDGLTNPVVDGNTLFFDFEVDDCDHTTISFTFPGNTPAGTPLSFSAVIFDAEGNETVTENNAVAFYGAVVNSYDPNIKNCNQPPYIDPYEAETLQYDIHFQNEGNFPALKVVVRDTLSPFTDLSTFRVLNHKHSMNYSIDPTTRVATFIFDNIYLMPREQDEAGSKGYVVYSIKENEGLPIGTEIRNTAYIYFDFNPPIVTNTTSNINAFVGLEETGLSQLIVFPNPVNGILHVQEEGFTSLMITDLSGKILLESTQSVIDVQALSKGTYLVQVKTISGTIVQKIVKD